MVDLESLRRMTLKMLGSGAGASELGWAGGCISCNVYCNGIYIDKTQFECI